MASPLMLGLEAADYFKLRGLSQSGLKDLAISPLRYWHRWINPNRPIDEPTPAMQIGSALHCAVLEPSKFEARYCRDLDAMDYPGFLVTMEDLRQWLRDKGHTPKGQTKDALIGQVQAVDANWPILDVLRERHAAENIGKTFFRKADWLRITGAAESLRNEPSIQRILENGEPEVCMFAKDPDTGVLLKCRMDFFAPTVTLDLKTFSQQRGKSIDEAVHDAIWFEKYHWQAYWYSKIRSINSKEEPRSVLLAFVESDPPYEVRLKSLRPGTLYWTRARLETEGLTRIFEEYSTRFNISSSWRNNREIERLEDEDIKQLAY